MDDVVIDEATHDVRNRVGLTDVREERVAFALAFAGAFNKAGDIDELDACRQHALWLHDGGQRIKTRVRYTNNADVRVDGAEGIVFRSDLRLGQRIEQCRFANVREADDSAFDAHVYSRYLTLCN